MITVHNPGPGIIALALILTAAVIYEAWREAREMENEEEWLERERKKEYLRSYQKAARRECDILDEIQELRMDKMLPGSRLDEGPRAAGYSDLSGYAAKMDELIERLKQERFEKVRLREKIEREINAMANEDEKAVLRYRYIQGMTWEAVCVRIGYSWRQTHRTHARALENFRIK